MENKNSLHAEFELTLSLMELVNSKEEYEYLQSEAEKLRSVLFSSCLFRASVSAGALKGGARW